MISFIKIAASAVLVLAIVFAILAVTTKKTFYAEVYIPAPPEEIWQVLMDTAKYPEWNPTFVQVQGSYEEGAKVINTVNSPHGPMIINAVIQAFVPNTELRQSGGPPGIITFDHRWLLKPDKDGTCVIQHEVDRGLYLWFWNSEWVQPAYERASAALKERVSGMTPATRCQSH